MLEEKKARSQTRCYRSSQIVRTTLQVYGTRRDKKGKNCLLQESCCNHRLLLDVMVRERARIYTEGSNKNWTVADYKKDIKARTICLVERIARTPLQLYAKDKQEVVFHPRKQQELISSQIGRNGSSQFYTVGNSKTLLQPYRKDQQEIVSDWIEQQILHKGIARITVQLCGKDQQEQFFF